MTSSGCRNRFQGHEANFADVRRTELSERSYRKVGRKQAFRALLKSLQWHVNLTFPIAVGQSQRKQIRGHKRLGSRDHSNLSWRQLMLGGEQFEVSLPNGGFHGR